MSTNFILNRYTINNNSNSLYRWCGSSINFHKNTKTFSREIRREITSVTINQPSPACAMCQFALTPPTPPTIKVAPPPPMKLMRRGAAAVH